MYNRSKMQNAPVHFSNLLEGFMNPEWQIADWRNSFNAAANIIETNENFEIQIAAPGLKKEEFKIDVDKNLLTIAYEHQESQSENKEKWLRQEFKHRSFKRSFNLTDKIDVNHISAVYENGILNVRLPKKEKEEAKSLNISVQ